MNTETKHAPSPGPWTIERNVAAGNVIHLAVTARQNGSDWMVCSITPMAWVRPIDLANAALIASAPDMAKEIAQLKADRDELLEALQGLLAGPNWPGAKMTARNLIAKHSK